MSGGGELMECGVVIVKPASSNSSMNEVKDWKGGKDGGNGEDGSQKGSQKGEKLGVERLFVSNKPSQTFIKNNFPSRNMSGGKMKGRKKRSMGGSGYVGSSPKGGGVYGGLSPSGGGGGFKTSISCNSLAPTSEVVDDLSDDERLKLISAHRFSSSSFLSALSKLSPRKPS